MAITDLVISYPDFKLSELIDPEQFDTNNADVQSKVNQILDVLNQITDSITDGGSGADAISLTAIAPFTSTKLQSFLEGLLIRIKSSTNGVSGADLVGSTAITGVTGTTVQAQLESLKSLLDAVTTNAQKANNDLTTHKSSGDHDTRYYSKSVLDGGQLDTRYYTESEVDSKFSAVNATNSTQTSDISNLKTRATNLETRSTNLEGRASTLESGKADKSTTYTKTEMDASLSGKTDKNGDHPGTWQGLNPADFDAGAMRTDLDAHVARTDNPHGVTSQQLNIITEVKNASTTGNDLPIGLSMYHTTSGSSGYPISLGTVVTEKVSNMRLTQWFYANGNNTHDAWFRHWYDTIGWTSWKQVEDSATATSKANTAEVNAKNFTKSFGIGGENVMISDANALPSTEGSGIYAMQQGGLNMPSGATYGGSLLHMVRSTRPSQIFMDYAGTRIYFRTYTTSGWSAWQELSDRVKRSGDTMTGDLKIKRSGGKFLFESDGGAKTAEIHFNANDTVNYGLNIKIDGQQTLYVRDTGEIWDRNNNVFRTSKNITDDAMNRLSIYNYRTSNVSISANVMTRVLFNSTTYGRQTSNWGNNTFTAPRAGVYAFNVSVTATNMPQYGTLEIYLYKNGSEWRRLDKQVAPGVTNLTVQGALTNYATTGDKYEFYVFSTHATALDNTTFATISALTE